MGLKYRYQGQIYDESEYQDPIGGSARLNIRTGPGEDDIARYGFTSNSTASQYCKITFNVDGKKVWLGRTEILLTAEQREMSRSSEYESTRQSTYTDWRSSVHTVSENRYTYTHTYITQKYSNTTSRTTYYTYTGTYTSQTNYTSSRYNYTLRTSSYTSRNERLGGLDIYAAGGRWYCERGMDARYATLYASGRTEWDYYGGNRSGYLYGTSRYVPSGDYYVQTGSAETYPAARQYTGIPAPSYATTARIEMYQADGANWSDERFRDYATAYVEMRMYYSTYYSTSVYDYRQEYVTSSVRKSTHTSNYYPWYSSRTATYQTQSSYLTTLTSNYNPYYSSSIYTYTATRTSGYNTSRVSNYTSTRMSNYWFSTSGSGTTHNFNV